MIKNSIITLHAFMLKRQISDAKVTVGDHVWVCPDSSILNGSVIGSGCVVATKSLLSDTSYPPSCLIAGAPAQAVKTNCSWKQ